MNEIQLQNSTPANELSHDDMSGKPNSNKLIFYVREVNSNISNRSWIQTVMVENEFINFKLDSGADVSILPYCILNKIFEKNPMLKCKLTEIPITLYAYGNFKIPTIGLIKLNCIRLLSKIDRVL